MKTHTWTPSDSNTLDFSKTNVVAFGNCVVPVTRIWQNINTNDTNWLAQAYSIGVGPIKSFEQIYIDGVPYFDAGCDPVAGVWYDGKETSSEFPNVSLGLRYGNNRETAHTDLIKHSDGELTAEHRGDRRASIGVLIERVIHGAPRVTTSNVKIEASVKGVGVIDPRNNTTDRLWTFGNSESYRNPACIIFTYLVDDYFGLGLPVESIDVTSFIELANYCDGRFTFDGYVDCSTDFKTILRELCTSFGGTIQTVQGRVVIIK